VINIQLVAMDKTLSDAITHLLASEPDISVVGRVSPVGKAVTPEPGEAPDVLLLQEGHGCDGLMAAALTPHPPSIVCIAANGQEGWTVRLATERQPIDAAGGGLAAVVRRAADHSRRPPLATEH
jgi:hypothetical protein